MHLLTDEQTEHDVVASAESLGFAPVTPVNPKEEALPSVEEYAQSLSAADREDFLSKMIQQTALNNVYRLNELLVEAATDPVASLRTKLDVLDANIKLSGITAKQVAKEQVGAQFSIQINIPQVGNYAASSRVIEGTSHEEVQLPTVLSGLLDQRQVHQSGGGSGGIDEDNDFDNQDSA